MWIMQENSKKLNDGAFRDVIETFQAYGFMLFPSIYGEEGVLSVESHTDFMFFTFDNPGVRIAVKPIDTEENAKYNTSNITRYMKDKYGFEFGKMVATNELMSSGYEYDYQYVTQEFVEMGDGVRECVLERQYSPKSPTCHNLAFIEGGVLVRVIYYDGNNVEIDDLRTLSLERVELD